MLNKLSKLIFKSKPDQTIDYGSLSALDLPKHVACIMDGNGRWAKKRGLPRSAGHRQGVERVKDIVRMSSDIGIEVLTLYAFSTENWKRPKAEVGVLMGLLIEYLKNEIEELHKNNVKLLIVGDSSKLPKKVIEEIEKSREKTKNNTGMILNIALNYGSRAEIVAAVKKISLKVSENKITVDDIDENMISAHLDTAGQPDPDLLIRTSGEQRLSNYLLYQLAYAEMIFLECFWPDFTNAEFEKALRIYLKRQRRFGGV
jgi:undecaprenyl diphosphate synthase